MTVPTEIAGLDELLAGGLPRRQTIVVTGMPGTGKTILCSQIAFSLARRGLPAVVATVTSEPHDKLVDSLRNFAFFDAARIGEDIFFVSAYSALKKGAKEAREMLLSVVRERGAKLLFIDGLRALRDLWQNESLLREFLYDLNVGLGTLDCIGLFSTEYALERLLELPEATTVDGIIALAVVNDGPQRFRRIEVHKLRGRGHRQGAHVALIDDSGVRAVPRLESLVRPPEDHALATGRARFGLAELDALLQGGLPCNSSTVVAGSTGIGKTLLAAHFLAAGAAAGERSLLISFFEPARAIVERAARVGIDLQTGLAAGLIEMRYHPQLEWEGDTIAEQLLRRIDEAGVKRLVIDSAAVLDQTIIDRARVASFLSALVVSLRERGVTTILTKEVPKIVGPELDFSDTPLTVTAENFIFLRFVELRGRLHRILSVLKMRDSQYDGDVREFTIADSGFKVLAPINTAEGLLTGAARAVGTSVAPEGTRP